MILSGSRLLVVLAHPDDEAFGPAGTLAMCAEGGAAVTVAMCTRGEAGRRRGQPPFCEPEELGDVRWGELRESCRILGAEPPVFLGLRDRQVSAYGDGHVKQLAGLMAAVSPDVLVTLGPDGGLSPHPDHQAVSRLATGAWLSLDRARRPRLCYYHRRPDTEAVRRMHGLEPNHLVVRVSRKGRTARLAALRAHRSQTQQVTSLWGPDRVVLNLMPAQEHFLTTDEGLGGRKLEGTHRILFSGRGGQTVSDGS